MRPGVTEGLGACLRRRCLAFWRTLTAPASTCSDVDPGQVLADSLASCSEISRSLFGWLAAHRNAFRVSGTNAATVTLCDRSLVVLYLC